MRSEVMKNWTIPPAKGFTAKEIDLAISLINQLTYKFNPKEYKDTYIGELKKIIEQKAKGVKVKPIRQETESHKFQRYHDTSERKH